jgi:peptidoglycan/xylan/chitin deacetylase (PgdA/CDA1 family)
VQREFLRPALVIPLLLFVGLVTNNNNDNNALALEYMTSIGDKKSFNNIPSTPHSFFSGDKKDSTDGETTDDNNMYNKPLEDDSSSSMSNVHSRNNDSTNDRSKKAVVLTFDDGWISHYTNAKPILDKYGFKATFAIVCNYVGKGDERMGWGEIQSLYEEGHDIASHTMNHADLSELPAEEMEYEVAESKQCLLNHGVDPVVFTYPFNGGDDNEAVISTVAQYYDLGRTATGPLMFLDCNANDNAEKEEKSGGGSCEDFSRLIPMNRYSIVGWSHDADRKNNGYDDSQMLDSFIEVVNSQDKYNNNADGTINAIPVIIWHKIDNTGEEYATSVDLFEAEIKYLYDNGFTVLMMSDLG